MKNFVFHNTTKIIFGKDTQLQVGADVKEYADKILLHFGGGTIKKTGLYDDVLKSLKSENIEVFELGGVEPNPRVSLINEGIDICRKNDIKFILAVGGGSVIDSAKAISLGANYNGDVWDFCCGKAEHKKDAIPLPVGVVLTIPAAGSESSDSAMITKVQNGGWLKNCMMTPTPKFAVMNPELTYTLPKYQTICGIMDIMSHTFERYFVTEKGVEFTDRLCEAVLKTMIYIAPKVIESPQNYDFRANIMWTGSVSHNGLVGTGRGGDWSCHDIEHQLSALYDITHGAGLAIITPAWMKYVYKHDIELFAQFATRVMEVAPNFGTDEEIALEGIVRFEAFIKSIGLPTTLSEININDNDFEFMATRLNSCGSFVNLKKEDILSIYKLAK